MTNHNGPPRDDFDSLVAYQGPTESTPRELYEASVDEIVAVIGNLPPTQDVDPEGIVKVNNALLDAAERFSKVVSEVSNPSDRLKTAADLLHESLALIRALYSRLAGGMDLSEIDDLHVTQTVLRDRVADFQGRGDMEPYKHAYYAVLKDEITVFPLGHTWEH